MKIQNLLMSLTLALVVTGCVTTTPQQGSEAIPRHAKRVQVALYGSTPRPSTTSLDVYDASPARPYKEIALLTCDGENSEEGVMTQAILWRARKIGADAVVRLQPDTRHGGFGIPNGKIYRYTAIVYTQ